MIYPLSRFRFFSLTLPPSPFTFSPSFSFFLVHFSPPPPDPNIRRFVVIATNDVYELDPVSGQGGLSRWAQLRNDVINNLYDKNAHLTIVAGDFFR